MRSIYVLAFSSLISNLNVGQVAPSVDANETDASTMDRKRALLFAVGLPVRSHGPHHIQLSKKLSLASNFLSLICKRFGFGRSTPIDNG
jgi:hypothetical protein